MNVASASVLQSRSRYSLSYAQIGVSALLLFATLLLYARTIAGLVHEWWVNPDYSHGLLVPFAVAYLLYRKKDQLAKLPVRPAALGIAIILFSQMLNLLGALGAEFFLQRFSLLLFLAGGVLFLCGWKHLRQTSFALFLLLLAIPLPAIIFNMLALPLQFIASTWAEGVLRFCSIPVYRDGNVLTLANQILNVSEACSGIRSLMSLFTLAVMIAYFLRGQWWWRALFVASSVPIAIVANSIRVAGTGVLTLWFGPAAAEGFYHAFSGWVIFLIAFAVLSAESMALQRWVVNRAPGAAQ